MVGPLDLAVFHRLLSKLEIGERGGPLDPADNWSALTPATFS